MNCAPFPGAVFVEMVSNPEVNHGQPVPVYENAPRTDGKPSINTPEGWARVGTPATGWHWDGKRWRKEGVNDYEL